MNIVVPSCDACLLSVGFLTPWMLLWSVAAAVPIALHFWARRQQNTIQWAAIDILQKVIDKRSRRLRVEQIVLLVIRTLVPVLLASTLAMPYLDSAADQAGENLNTSRRYWILAIDTSHSMSYTGESRVSKFEQAKAQAIQIVRDAGEADMFSIVAMRASPQAVVAVPVVEKEMVVEAIDRLAVSYAGMNVAASLDLIEDLAGRADGEAIPSNPIVHVFSDLGEDSWGGEASPMERLDRFNGQFELHVQEVRSSSPSNAAVSEILLPSGALLQGTNQEIGVRIEQFGSPTEKERSRTLQISIDGQVVASRAIRLGTDTSRVFAVEVPWRKVGPQVLSAQLDLDGLVQDNVRRRYVEVVNATRVLIVEQVRGAGLPIEVALAVRAGGDETLKTKTIASASLSQEELDDWDVIILQDVASLSGDQADRLTSAVGGGMGLVVLHGPQAISAAWNTVANEAAELLKYELVSPSEESVWSVDPLDYQSPIAAPFEGYPDSGLLTSPIFRFWQIQGDQDLEVDLAIDGGQPLVVHAELGKGRVVSMLTAPQGTPSRLGSASRSNGEVWNALATWPSFVPLIQSICDFAHGQAPDHTIEIGGIFQGTIDPGDLQASGVKIARPNGDIDTLTVKVDSQRGDRSWIYARTDQPGVYAATLDGQDKQEFVVNVPLAESRLVSIDSGSLPATRKRDSTKDNEPQREAYQSNSVWRWLLLSVAFLLVCETCLAWWLGRRVG
ncbi:MAG: hypothetical protein Aurels2KO_14440 [Aureliella sp.]